MEIKTMLLNNQWVKEDITGEIRKYHETNEDENTANRNLWNAAKAVPRGNCTPADTSKRYMSNGQPHLTT